MFQKHMVNTPNGQPTTHDSSLIFVRETPYTWKDGLYIETPSDKVVCHDG